MPKEAPASATSSSPVEPQYNSSLDTITMAEDDVDLELLELLRQSLGIGIKSGPEVPKTHILRDAHFVYDNAIDVALDPFSINRAATSILSSMKSRSYSPKTWSSHPLHPKPAGEWDEDALNFVFTMDLLNFSFYSEHTSDDDHRSWAVEWQGAKYTGYWAMVACLQRALEEEIRITSSDWWQDENESTAASFCQVFRGTTESEEEMPLLAERIICLREAGRILYEHYECKVSSVIKAADKSAVKLVNLLAEAFGPVFNDEHRFERKKVRFLKRAQIFVADVWACFERKGYGEFYDIDEITMFADYRIPQMLHSMGCLAYSPPLDFRIRSKGEIESGCSWEVQLRGCTVWCVELIRRKILELDPEAEINAILVDFFLYDTMKENIANGIEVIPHHRTRSIWY